jgi:hypothetical protein
VVVAHDPPPEEDPEGGEQPPLERVGQVLQGQALPRAGWDERRRRGPGRGRGRLDHVAGHQRVRPVLYEQRRRGERDLTGRNAGGVAGVQIGDDLRRLQHAGDVHAAGRQGLRVGGGGAGVRHPAADDGDAGAVGQPQRSQHPQSRGVAKPAAGHEQLTPAVPGALHADPPIGGGLRERRTRREQRRQLHRGLCLRGLDPVLLALLAGAVELPLTEARHDRRGDDHHGEQGQPSGLQRRAPHPCSVARMPGPPPPGSAPRPGAQRSARAQPLRRCSAGADFSASKTRVR